MEDSADGHGNGFFAFTNNPRKILAFDLFKIISAYLHTLKLGKPLSQDTWVRKQAASSAGIMRSNRTKQILMKLSSAAQSI